MTELGFVTYVAMQIPCPCSAYFFYLLTFFFRRVVKYLLLAGFSIVSGEKLLDILKFKKACNNK
jgi:hypothetical protein